MLPTFALVFATITAHAAPTTAPKPPERLKVLVLDVTSTDLTPSEKVTLANLEAAHLGEDGRLDVLSGQDVKQLVTLQGQAQEIGVNGNCTDACMAEVAGAIGAGVVVSTQAGKLGDTLVVTLAVFDAAKAKSVGRKSVTAQSLGELPDRMAPALDDLMRPLLPESVRMAMVQPAPVVTSTTTSPPPPATTQATPTPAVQTRIVSAPTPAAPPSPPPPQEQPQPTEQPQTSIAAEDDSTLWILLGVGAAILVVVVAVLVATDGDPDDLFK